MDPFIVLQDAAGVTEAGLAGEGDDAELVRMLRADIFGIAELVGIAASEHFIDGLEHIFRDGGGVFGINSLPVILKDLADGDGACDDIHGDNNVRAAL